MKWRIFRHSRPPVNPTPPWVISDLPKIPPITIAHVEVMAGMFDHNAADKPHNKTETANQMKRLSSSHRLNVTHFVEAHCVTEYIVPRL